MTLSSHPLELSGYLSREYASSLVHVGEPIALESSGGWGILRPIPKTSQFDAMGCYPVLCLEDWTKLGSDLEKLSKQAVAFSAVLDPFGSFDPREAKSFFPDLFRPFKEHLIVNLSEDWRTQVNDKRHLKKAQKAALEMEVFEIEKPAVYLDTWCSLYGDLVTRHNLTGLTAFSKESFRRQLQVPGLRVFAAKNDGAIFGMILWYRHGEVAYYHLAAYSQRGYDKKSSFALFSYSLDQMRESGVKWVDLGAGAGLSMASDGLTRFKSGWTSLSKTAYLVGRILDSQKYKALCDDKPPTDYFPAYRSGP